MTRAKAHPTRPEEQFGHVSRAKVTKTNLDWPRRWLAYRAGNKRGRFGLFKTHAEAMAYALGNDTKETKK